MMQHRRQMRGPSGLKAKAALSERGDDLYETPESDLVMLTQVRNDNDDDIFWRKLILPEEDRRRLSPDMTGKGGYRWFRSKNVVCSQCESSAME
jgi:hypothetical protein